MRRLIAVLGAATLILTGCGGEDQIGTRDDRAHFWQDLGDGTKVQCWFITQGQDRSAVGGPTCDWVAYHQTYDPQR